MRELCEHVCFHFLCKVTQGRGTCLEFYSSKKLDHWQLKKITRLSNQIRQHNACDLMSHNDTDKEQATPVLVLHVWSQDSVPMCACWHFYISTALLKPVPEVKASFRLLLNCTLDGHCFSYWCKFVASFQLLSGSASHKVHEMMSSQPLNHGFVMLLRGLMEEMGPEIREGEDRMAKCSNAS